MSDQPAYLIIWWYKDVKCMEESDANISLSAVLTFYKQIIDTK